MEHIKKVLAQLSSCSFYADKDSRKPDFAIKYTWEIREACHHYDVYITGEMYTCETLGKIGTRVYNPRTLHYKLKKDADFSYSNINGYERDAHSFLYGYFMGWRESDLFNNRA